MSMYDTINTQLIAQFFTPSLVIMLLKGISLFSDPESKGLQFDCIMVDISIKYHETVSDRVY